jgi:hypothetical protein
MASRRPYDSSAYSLPRTPLPNAVRHATHIPARSFTQRYRTSPIANRNGVAVDITGFRSKNMLYPLPALPRAKLNLLRRLSRQQEFDLVEEILLRHRRVQAGELEIDMTASVLDSLVQRGPPVTKGLNVSWGARR